MNTASIGRRGKAEEKKVQAYLERISVEVAEFDYERLSDARSAGGMGAKKVVGDFSFFSPHCHGVLEVKSVAHDFRVPAKNITQLPKLHKREMAGGRCYLLVYHSTIGRWRRIPAYGLETKSTGSWDLSAYATYEKLSDALPRHLMFAEKLV